MNNPLASSPRAILVPRLYLLLALVPCGTGCAAPAAEAGRDPAAREASREQAQADSPRILDFEELFESKWRQATREPIASPSSTPFDDDPDLRELYLWSFRMGVDRGLQDRERFSIGCILKHPESRYDEARMTGLQQGRKTVIDLLRRIYTDIARELEELEQELERLR